GGHRRGRDRPRGGSGRDAGHGGGGGFVAGPAFHRVRVGLRVLPGARAHDARGRDRDAAGVRRDLPRRRRLADRARPRLPVGPPPPHQAPLRPVREPAPRPPAARRREPALPPARPRHHRGAGEHRRRVLGLGGTHLQRYAARDRGPGEHLYPSRRRANNPLRLRGGEGEARPSRGRHEVKRHQHHDAVFRRDLQRDSARVPERGGLPDARGRPRRPARARPGAVRRHRGLQPLRGPSLGDHGRRLGRHRHRPVGEPQPGRDVPLPLRAHPRLRPGHRRSGRRQPRGRHLGRRPHAGARRPPGDGKEDPRRPRRHPGLRHQDPRPRRRGEHRRDDGRRRREPEGV
ncbi:MAG: D-malate dehydrogenase [decarboxylating], partial [uncultured Rubrobacteraceae bacterium]